MQKPLFWGVASLFVDLCDCVLRLVLAEVVAGKDGESDDTGPVAALIPQAGHLSGLYSGVFLGQLHVLKVTRSPFAVLQCAAAVTSS